MSKSPKNQNKEDSKGEASKIGVKRELTKKIRPKKNKKTSRGK